MTTKHQIISVKTIVATVRPSYATNKSVPFSSSNNKLSKVIGEQIIGEVQGNETISIYTKSNKNIKETFLIKVNKENLKKKY